MFRYPNFHRIAIVLLAGASLLAPLSGRAQTLTPTFASEHSPAQSQDNTITSNNDFMSPFAGKYEARVGSSYEPSHKKLRLDIGSSIDLLHWGGKPEEGGRPFAAVTHEPKFSFGTDFFTWTRLRSTGSFKFPVEAVDYFFGINGAMLLDEGPVTNVRLRVAHISAHLVDGDPSFTSPVQQYMTYSREFADLMVGFGAHRSRLRTSDQELDLRPYVGALWLFHTIPDTLGRITPYAGIDGFWRPGGSLPFAVKYGYEARLNTELEPIGEHLLRLGLKFGSTGERTNGVLIEGSYYAGRSPYGQHFSEREHFWSLGFAVDF